MEIGSIESNKLILVFFYFSMLIHYLSFQYWVKLTWKLVFHFFFFFGLHSDWGLYGHETGSLLFFVLLGKCGWGSLGYGIPLNKIFQSILVIKVLIYWSSNDSFSPVIMTLPELPIASIQSIPFAKGSLGCGLGTEEKLVPILTNCSLFCCISIYFFKASCFLGSLLHAWVVIYLVSLTTMNKLRVKKFTTTQGVNEFSR